jgi:hypothetical protein
VSGLSANPGGPLLGRWEKPFEMLLGSAAALILACIMLLTCVDVAGRYVFSEPVPGGLYNVSFFLGMNEAKFKALPKADQDAILKVSGENYARMAGKVWDREDDAGLKAMQGEKIIIRNASPQFVAEIKSKTDPIEQAWYAEAKAKGVDGAAVMAEFRAEIKKLSGK